MPKYKIVLSMYGNVVERAEVEIDAFSEKDAQQLALKRSEEGEIKFTNKQEAPDGWLYQVEEIEEVK